MSEILLHYEKVHATTWVYLSSLLMLGLFFKFNRLWSVRNLDLVALILLSPGLLLVHYGIAQHSPNIEHLGYVWLFVTGGLFIVRLLLDSMMVRRPLLEPNLSVGGMTFIGVSMLVFLMANVITHKPEKDDAAIARAAATQGAATDAGGTVHQGPGYPLLYLLPAISTQTVYGSPGAATASETSTPGRPPVYVATTRLLAILSHLAVVFGMVLIGYRHFDNIRTGIAAALVYLMLPYTAIWTGRVDHVLPAALLVWAIQTYRRPLISGMLMGLAIGVIYYPIFLLPLWCSFYWQRGLLRFASGVASMVLLLALSLVFTSPDAATYFAQLGEMFGWRFPRMTNLGGFWHFHDGAFRIPVLAAFLALCGSLALWPAQKNLGTLMSCSAAVMLGAQFWQADAGGLYMAWYLPLALLTIFRPNLEDRVALTVLGQGWTPKRLQLRSIAQAA